MPHPGPFSSVGGVSRPGPHAPREPSRGALPTARGAALTRTPRDAWSTFKRSPTRPEHSRPGRRSPDGVALGAKKNRITKLFLVFALLVGTPSPLSFRPPIFSSGGPLQIHRFSYFGFQPGGLRRHSPSPLSESARAAGARLEAGVRRVRMCFVNAADRALLPSAQRAGLGGWLCRALFRAYSFNV